MAWIESHQTLANHPKTRKLARALGVGRAQAIGHLHLLWWWCLDYAPDGDLARFEPADLADAADWDGVPDTFAHALHESGFLTAERAVHDWDDYAGKLIDRRKANAERMREARSQVKTARSGTKKPRADAEKQRATHVPDADGARVGLPYTTVPNTTEPNRTGGDDARAAARPAAPAVAEQPLALVEALCDELGQDAAVLGRREREKQCAGAKRLLEAGASADDVRLMVRWLRAQDWVTGGIDLFLLDKQLGKWRLAGKPEAAPNRRAPPGGDGGLRAGLRRIANGGAG